MVICDCACVKPFKSLQFYVNLTAYKHNYTVNRFHAIPFQTNRFQRDCRCENTKNVETPCHVIFADTLTRVLYLPFLIVI